MLLAKLDQFDAAVLVNKPTNHILGAEEDIVVAAHVLYPLVVVELELGGVGWGDNPADGTEGLRGLNIFHIILALHTIAEYIKL